MCLSCQFKENQNHVLPENSEEPSKPIELESIVHAARLRKMFGHILECREAIKKDPKALAMYEREDPKALEQGSIDLGIDVDQIKSMIKEFELEILFLSRAKNFDKENIEGETDKSFNESQDTSTNGKNGGRRKSTMELTPTGTMKQLRRLSRSWKRVNGLKTRFFTPGLVLAPLPLLNQSHRRIPSTNATQLATQSSKK